jgi:hypothetical protein
MRKSHKKAMQTTAADTTETLQEFSSSFLQQKLCPQYYLNNPEFSYIWKYLSANELLGRRKTDHNTAIVAYLCVVQNDKLCLFAMLRSNKQSADGPIRSLSHSRAFQLSSLLEIHHSYGHSSDQRLFQPAWPHIYFETHTACSAMATTCPTCQQVKLIREN